MSTVTAPTGPSVSQTRTSLLGETPLADRYPRQSLVSGWDQDALRQASAIVAGAGALGNEVIKSLALMGIGHLTIVDFDTVAHSNLSRTILFREGDIGMPKAEVAARRVRELNPEVSVHAIVGDIATDLGLGDLARATMVFGCVDSIGARWAINRRCLEAGVGWINGGTNEWHGEVARYDAAGGACYECTMTDQMFARMHGRFECGFRIAGASDVPMASTSSLSSVIAGIQVSEALQSVMGTGAGASPGFDPHLKPGQRLTVQLRPYRMHVDDLPWSDTCLAHSGRPPEVPVRLDRPWEVTTAVDVLEAARAIDPGVDCLGIGFELVTDIACHACGTHQDVMLRRNHTTLQAMTCPGCGAPFSFATNWFIHSGTPLASRPLREMGLPRHEWVRAYRSASPDAPGILMELGGSDPLTN